jgi:hypothetical protein
MSVTGRKATYLLHLNAKWEEQRKTYEIKTVITEGVRKLNNKGKKAILLKQRMIGRMWLIK